MDRWQGKVAVVTGISSGIGRAVATQFVEAGLKVVGLARRRERGEELSKRLEGGKGVFYYIEADVTKEDDILNANEWIEKNLGPVHILVNNAGTASVTTLVDGELHLWKKILDTNVLGMRKNNVDGHIIHINSLSGHRVFFHSTLNVYAASKYAVTALTETLRQELNSIGSKIKISSVCPGIVDTEMLLGGSVDDFVAVEEGVPTILKPKDIADTILYILSTPPHVQIHEVQMRAQGQHA
ncbi:hypothetical protein RI129_010420 [Pyrocoelia pectoralis]|uniref:Farnesol dehydrogenase n=1 Tax=Pyrocoelia pectoralis TaxID=417401 RepID=A0AAN7ZJX8_9COLE